jgi:CubicO group peptidase (beta-lactamase class C family)
MEIAGMDERIERRCAGRLGLCFALVAGVSAAAAQPVDRESVTAALSQMEAMAQQLVDEAAVPGLAVAVVHDDEVVYLGGFGLREIGSPETVDADTVFQLASMSKPISSTVVAALVGKQVVAWDSRVAALRPRFQLHDPYPTAQVTLRDLFAHRSGLPGTSGDDLEDIGYDREAITDRLRLVPPSSSFRAGYAYSNAGLTQGALAAAAPTGKAWEDVADEMLYQPLGMTSTSSRYADFVARENRAALHIPVDGAWAAKLTREPDAQAPAGGVSSTVRDLAQWMRLELSHGSHDGETLIAPFAIDATHEPLMYRGQNPVTGRTSFYGLGWNVEFGPNGPSWGHAGAFSVGARTVVTLYPEAGIGMVVLSNAFPTGVPEGLSDSFFDLMFTGAVTRDWLAPWDALFASLFDPAVEAARATYAAPPDPATPALPLAAYAGTYANDYVGEAAVADDGGALVVTVGPDGARSYPLTHFDRDIFLYYPSPELPDLPSTARFSIGPDGRAEGVTLESLDRGTLARSDG